MTTRRNRCGSTRARRTLTALAVSALAVTSSGAIAASAATNPPTPAVSVAPATGLTNLQQVTVTGTGLTPGDSVAVRENCLGSCDDILAGPVVVGADGRLTATVAVRRYIWDTEASTSNVPVDCAYDTSCSIDLTHHDDSDEGYATIASQRIDFSRAVPASPSATLDAPQPLPPAIVTTVHGHGFSPGGTVYVAHCASQRTLNGLQGVCRMYDSPSSGTADGGGNVTLTVGLRREAPFWNCADPNTTCSIRLWDARPNALTLPITFDPTAPAPPTPTITVDHTTSLGVGPTVHVHGADFRPNRDVQVTECRVIPTTEGPACSGVTFGGADVTVRSGSDGTFDTTLTLQRYLIGEALLLGPAVDCAAIGTCGIVGREDPQDAPAPVALSFALRSADPVISFTGAFVLEGTGSTPTPVLAHAHLDRPADHPVRFRLNSTDYTDTVTNLDEYTMPAGATDMTITLAVRADAIHEPTEVAHFFPTTMVGAQFAVANPTIGIVIIDDDPVPSIVVPDVLVAENDPSGVALVHLTLAGATSSTVIVHYRTVPAGAHPAHPGTDYLTTEGTVEVMPTYGGWIRIPLVDDHRAEPLERFDVRLSGAQNAQLPVTRARVWIADNERIFGG